MPTIAAPARAGPDALQSLRDRPFVVVAVVDTGVNPYHDDFARPEMTEHPSKFIEGFPKDMPSLQLSLSAPNMEAAVRRDADAINGVATTPAWIPGTNIIAAYNTQVRPNAFLDKQGHGTMVASLAGGAIYGPRDPNILLVAVTGDYTEGLAWAAKQPWIDVISNSWTSADVEQLEDGAAAASREAARANKIICFASGNEFVPFWMHGEQGPSWPVHVGAVNKESRGEYSYTGWPNDVMGISNGQAASHESVTAAAAKASGTSAATPRVCGEIASVLAATREALGDTRQGRHAGGAMAVGPNSSGYLSDGKLSDEELIDAVQSTAQPASSEARPNPSAEEILPVIPALPFAPWIRGGYGIVDVDSAADAFAVITGKQERPQRESEDMWIQQTDALRDLLWGSPP